MGEWSAGGPYVDRLLSMGVSGAAGEDGEEDACAELSGP